MTLDWIVIDLTNGKFDGFYAEEKMANAVREMLAEENPELKFVVAKITTWGTGAAFLADKVLIGADA